MRRIAIPERGAEALFGTHDENLRFLEDTLKVRIKTNGSELLVEGGEAAAETVAQIFDQLGGLMKDGYAVASGDVRLAAQLLSQDGGVRLRDYLMKNVYVMTATQNQQLGYALDSRWYGIGEFTGYMRDRLGKLTLDDVNRAIRAHLSAKNLSVVIVTKDAKGLREKLVADAFSPIQYDAEKPADPLAEDKVVGARKLALRAEDVKVTPVEEVFAK